MLAANDIINRLLEPVSRAFTGDAARRLVEARLDPELEAWMGEMADKANEGELTADERSTYEYVLTAGTVISILQAKARATLASSTPSAA